MKENKIYKLKNNIFKPDNDKRINFTTKFEEFLPSDKQKTLEKFIFDNEVYSILKDIIFNRTNNKSTNTNTFNKNTITNTLHFSGTESKFKKVNDIPNIKYIKKNVALFPLMHNNKINCIIPKNEDLNKNRALTLNK